MRFLPHGLLVSLLTCLLLALPATAAPDPRLDGLGEMPAPDAYRLALELEAAGETALAAQAYERVLETDPEHRAARRALGYELVDDRWLAGDALYRARGFIHHGGKWMTAQEFAESTRPAREAAEQRAGEERVLGLLGAIASGDADRERQEPGQPPAHCHTTFHRVSTPRSKTSRGMCSSLVWIPRSAGLARANGENP